MRGAWPPICTSVLPLFHGPRLKRWRLTSRNKCFFSLVVQVVCDSFPGPWPLYQNHICPSASSELVIEFLGHDIYQDLDCSLVLRLISTTQPRNIPHTIKNSILVNIEFRSWTYRKKCPVSRGMIFRHSMWHIFWHSVCHIFWHSIWHIFWHSIWQIFWHSVWHTFWLLFVDSRRHKRNRHALRWKLK